MAIPKFKQIDLACPICKKPFGSGGKRVIIFLYLPESKSLSIISVIKFFINSL